MNTRRIKTFFFIILTVSLVSCSQNAGKSVLDEKSTHEKEFEAKITKLCQENTGINNEEERGISILYWAVELNYVDAAKTLLQNGADPDVRPKKGGFETALYATINNLSYVNDPFESQKIEKSKTIAELLIQHRANVNHSPKMGNTPLHKATLRGRTDLCELFIQNGAKVNVSDALGNTSLHYAAKEGYWESTQFLLQNGTQPTAENKFLETAMSLAKKRTEEDLNQQIRKKTKLDYNPGSDYDRAIEVFAEHGAY
ncbi:MAG: ankyrin repeat domain-containing protein [Thermodesulfobacteriota bacterium]|nr:ankyrin repeat domain-containing protein [Thermodesulfobacteriota bacterium]